MEIEIITRRWGNSMAIVIPSYIVKKQKIIPNQKMIISISETPTAEGLQGLIPSWKNQGQKIKDEMKKGWN